jgi:hypothetical protein
LFWAGLGLALYAWHIATSRGTKEHQSPHPDGMLAVPNRNSKIKIQKYPNHHLLKGDQT